MSCIFSKAQWDKEGEMAYETKPAGTGPYIFKERKIDQYVLYERAPTPHWKRGVVDWKEIQMTWTIEEPTRYAQILAGETHLTEVNKDLVDQAVAKGYKLIRSRGTAQQVEVIFGGLYFGTEDPTGRYTEYGGTTGKLDLKVPWTKKEVRQAMNKAINREEILQVLYKGRAELSMWRVSIPTCLAGIPPGRNVSRRCMATTPRRPKSCWPRRVIPTASKPRRGWLRLPGHRNSSLS